MTQKVGLEISARGGRRAAKELGLVDKGLKTTGRSARGATSALRGLMPAIGGAMIAAKAKDVLAFTDALGVIQGMAGITTRDARALGDEILSVGEKHGLARDEILGAIKVFQDNGGYLKEGRAMLSDLGMAAAATGTDIKDLAVISSKLIEQGFTPSAAFGVIETLNAQANQATVSLKDVGRVVSELISAGGAYGKAFSGAEGVKGLGELLQVGGSALGNAERAKTGSLAVLRDLAGKEAMLSKKFGVAIFSDKEKKNVRSMRDIMTDIAKATGGAIGGKKGLNKIFSAESMGVAAGFLKSLEQSKSGGGILFKLDMGSSADIESQYKTRMDGVAKEAQQVKIALAQLENGITRHGMSLVSWIGNNTSEAATIGGGMATAFILRSGMSAALSSATAGLTGMAGAIAGAAGPVVGALALGAALGTLADQALGISDWFSDELFAYFNGGERGRRKLGRQEVEYSETMGATSRSKVKAEQVVEGGPDFLRRDKGTKGRTREDRKRKRREAREDRVTVIVKPAGGIDKAKTELRRGKKQ